MKMVRKSTYKAARLIGDINALSSFSFDKTIKRILNKWIGKNIVSKLWIK